MQNKMTWLFISLIQLVAWISGLLSKWLSVFCNIIIAGLDCFWAENLQAKVHLIEDRKEIICDFGFISWRRGVNFLFFNCLIESKWKRIERNFIHFIYFSFFFVEKKYNWLCLKKLKNRQLSGLLCSYRHITQGKRMSH